MQLLKNVLSGRKNARRRNSVILYYVLSRCLGKWKHYLAPLMAGCRTFECGSMIGNSMLSYRKGQLFFLMFRVLWHVLQINRFCSLEKGDFAKEQNSHCVVMSSILYFSCKQSEMHRTWYPHAASVPEAFLLY